MSWKDAIWEKSDAAPKPEPVMKPRSAGVSVPAGNFPTSTPLDTVPSVQLSDSMSTNRYYTTLATKTDPSLVPTLQKIFALAKPLEPIITDRALRMRAAVAQAGVDLAAVSSEFQRLSDLLKQESTSFHQELEAKNQLIASKQNDAASLEVQLRNIRAEINDAVEKASRAEGEFTAAFNQRDAELKQLAAESTNWR